MDDKFSPEEINNFMNKLHQAYLKRIAFFDVPPTELTRFSWSEHKHVCIYVIKVYSDQVSSISRYDHSTMFFATKSDLDRDRFKYIDLVHKTEVPAFSKINDADVIGRVAWLLGEELINKAIKSCMIQSSTSFSFADFDIKNNLFCEAWAKDWVDQEYYLSQKAEKNPTPVQKFPDFPNIKQRFFIDRYHFKDMLKTLNDSQFTDEFDQCLFAFENEKWFLCATGLGSCLEHLMLIILTNYDKNGFKDKNGRGLLNGFPKNPTAKDYVSLFTKEPISMTSRQATFINLLFMARNSVDHHNTGKTQKNLCDILLDGISDMYNDYYPSSVLFKPSN